MKIGLFVSLLFLGVFIWSCDDEKTDLEPRSSVSRTVLVYIVGDNSVGNNLTLYLLNNFRDMVVGMENTNIDDCNLVVYSDVKDAEPCLIHVENKAGKVLVDTIETYEERNAMAKSVMQGVVRRTVELFPAESYGFVFLSHSDAWSPAKNVASRSIGDYRGSKMDIADFHEVLRSFSQPLRFLLFDSCYMQAIEVAYELRDCVDYFIASPSEIPGPGAPYKTLVPLFFTDIEPDGRDAIAVGKHYYQTYADMYGDNTSEWSYGVSVSVVSSKALDGLAKVTSSILPKYIQNGETVSTSTIMRYDGIRSYHYYDLDGLIISLTGKETDEYMEWRKAYDKAVIFWGTTPRNYYSSGFRTMDGAEGLSAYIPFGSFSSSLNLFYRTYQWYNEAGWSNTGW